MKKVVIFYAAIFFAVTSLSFINAVGKVSDEFNVVEGKIVKVNFQPKNKESAFTYDVDDCEICKKKSIISMTNSDKKKHTFSLHRKGGFKGPFTPGQLKLDAGETASWLSIAPGIYKVKVKVID